MDGQTDRPMTRHGNRSSGPKNLTVTTMISLATLQIYAVVWPCHMACAIFRRILVSTSEWLHGWSVAMLHGYWRAVLKYVQGTTGSHTQPGLIPSRVDAMNSILRCAHVQQGVWYRSVFPTVSRSLFQHVKRTLIRVAAGVTISTWQPLWTTLDNASVPCVTLLHCNRCKCKLAGVQCTALCNCEVACINKT